MMKKKIVKRLAGATLLAVMCFLVWGHSKCEGRKSCTKQIFAMDTMMDFTAYGKDCEEAVDAAIKEVQRLDALFSTGDDSSEISILNRTGSGRGLSNDTIAIFRRGLEIYADTDGDRKSVV